ncbi:MAG: acyl carrier protein [Bacteroidales bacterium]|jgi:acyl carrier protein|nr:acyl carrier protein [Bacteroidales bacterium]
MRTIDEIQKQVIRLLAQIADVEEDVFQPNVSIWDTLDSLMGLELSVRIERDFGIRLTKEDFTANNTPYLLATLIYSKQK